MSAQQNYWDMFANLKRDSVYVNRYHAKVENIDRSISMFSAVAASTSIAGWAVWQHFSFVWGSIIAASQVLIAVRAYLPYKARLQGLSALGPELDTLALEAEDAWYDVANGKLTDAEIHRRTMDLKRKCQKVTSSAFKGTSLPEDGKLLEVAGSLATDYMTSLA
jgi:hypothetical protein